MNKRFTAALIGLVALVAAACGTSTPNGSAGDTSASGKTITFLEGGSNDFSDGDVLEFVSLLKKDGYNVHVSLISDPSTALRAVIANQADFFLAPPTEVILADAHSHAQVKVISGEEQSSNYVILALPKYNLSNLSGATMAIAAPGTAGQVVADAALRLKGINTSTIHNVTVGGTSARVSAILSGRVDLAPVLAPSAVPALATHKVKLLLNTSPVIGPYMEAALVANQRYLQQNSQTAQKAVNALIDAERFAETNEAGYIALVNKAKLSNGMSPSEERAAWKAEIASRFFAVNGGICPQDVSRTLRLSYQTGGLPSSVKPPNSVWLDTSYVHNYLKEHHQSVNTC